MTQTIHDRGELTLDERLVSLPPTPEAVRATSEPDRPDRGPDETKSRRQRLLEVLRGRRRSMIWFVPLIAVAAAVQFINMTAIGEESWWERW